MSRSHRDNVEINQHEHDEQLDAKRVLVVGGEFKFDSDKISKSLQEALSKTKFELGTTNSMEVQVVKVPEIVRETEIRIIEVPVQTFIPQIQIVEIPKIVIETKVVEVEKPIFIEKVETVYIDKPILGQTVYKESHKFKVAAIMSILLNLALLYRVFIN